MEYVQIDSETKNEKEFADFIENKLKVLGLEVYRDNAGEKLGSNSGNIIAKLKETRSGEPVLFSCHMDTVSPGKGIKPIIKDNIIYSDGTTILGGDDKAGIAAIVEALTVIKGPAQDKIDVKVIGKPAHAGVCPEEGVSAIQIASEAISNMKLLRIDEETTANIGTINGGKVTNIVCPEIIINAEARSLSSEKLDVQTAHMVQCFENAAKSFGGKVEIKTTRAYGPFVVAEEDEIVDHAKMACKNIGVKSFTAATGGGSDTNILNGNGIKAINLGIGERKAHTLEEHMKIEDLVNASKLVLEIIKLA